MVLIDHTVSDVEAAYVEIAMIVKAGARGMKLAEEDFDRGGELTVDADKRSATRAQAAGGEGDNRGVFADEYVEPGESGIGFERPEQ